MNLQVGIRILGFGVLGLTIRDVHLAARGYMGKKKLSGLPLRGEAQAAWLLLGRGGSGLNR